MIQYIVVAFLLQSIQGKVFFHESFDEDWAKTWHPSTKSDAGKFETTFPKHNTNETDKWLKTTQDARFYHAAAAFEGTVDTSKDTLVVQYVVDFEQDIDCGGGYLKLFRPGVDLTNVDGNTEYAIMFGPDVCGYDTKMIHFILNYKEKNHLIKNKISFYPDTKPHVFTLILHMDATYEVLLDGESKSKGKLKDDWDLLPPKLINDPSDVKPADWVDEKEIPDATDVKPEDWDQPETIVDPSAKKPDEWNEEEDGVWSAPTIANPNHKGEWTAKMIPNPAYKGEWIQKQMENPEYKEDPTIGQYEISGVGIDLWQVKSGTLFNEILVCNSEKEAEEHRKHLNQVLEPLKKAVDDAKKKEEEEHRKQSEKASSSSSPHEAEKGMKSEDEGDEDHHHDKAAAETEKTDGEAEDLHAAAAESNSHEDEL